MQHLSNRAIVIVSGLLTLIVLSTLSLGVALHNGWLQVAPREAASTRTAAPPDPMPSEAGATAALAPGADARPSPQAVPRRSGLDGAAPSRLELDEAYRALEEAYAQIKALQAAQGGSQAGPGTARAFAQRDEEHEGAERRHGRREGDHQ